MFIGAVLNTLWLRYPIEQLPATFCTRSRDPFPTKYDNFLFSLSLWEKLCSGVAWVVLLLTAQFAEFARSLALFLRFCFLFCFFVVHFLKIGRQH